MKQEKGWVYSLEHILPLWFNCVCISHGIQSSTLQLLSDQGYIKITDTHEKNILAAFFITVWLWNLEKMAPL